MAIKDWTTNYPTSLDTTTQMPSIVNNDDATRASQINSVRDAVIELEAIVGSDENEEGSLVNTVAVLQDFANGFPPASPDSKDDEFNGTSLDAKWTWVAAGAPSGGAEEYAVENGMLNMTIEGDAGGDVTQTHAHIIEQAVPSIASDWRVSARVITFGLGFNTRIGVVVSDSDGTWTSDTHFVFMGSIVSNYQQGGEVSGGRMPSAGYVDFSTLINYETIQKMVFSIRNDSANETFYFGMSYDGIRFHESSFTPIDYSSGGYNWTPAKCGIMFWANDGAGSTAEHVGHIEWFRVTML